MNKLCLTDTTLYW